MIALQWISRQVASLSHMGTSLPVLEDVDTHSDLLWLPAKLECELRLGTSRSRQTRGQVSFRGQAVYPGLKRAMCWGQRVLCPCGSCSLLQLLRLWLSSGNLGHFEQRPPPIPSKRKTPLFAGSCLPASLFHLSRIYASALWIINSWGPCYFYIPSIKPSVWHWGGTW
jgi:hypothetical protein